MMNEGKVNNRRETGNEEQIVGSGPRRSNLFYIIDGILLLILISLVLYSHINGYYINKEIHFVEVCGGNPTEEGLKTLEELEIIINTTKEVIKDGPDEWKQSGKGE